MEPVTYELKLLSQWRIHPIFHASLLTPYLETKAHGPNFPQPPPDIFEGEEQFEVEVIVAHKPQGREYCYLMKWMGYPSSDNTWQTSGDLKGAHEILDSYNHSHHL